ncbi:hypothetical protein DFH07DRAFT_747117, partial [Mycena maculata]
MLRSIILQLSAQSPYPYAALDRQYQLSKGQTLPTYQNLVDVLETLFSELQRTYLVLDALDECNDSDLHVLLRLISRLRCWIKSPLHILLTSQDRTIFTKGLNGVPQLSLEFSTTQNDIKLFVAGALQCRPDLEHLVLRAEEITAKVVEKSNGMFRLAGCLLDELSRRKLDPALDKVLANLPGDLFGIYGRFLEPIDRDDFIHVARVLRWIVFSARPVTLQRLKEALAFDFLDPHQYIFDPANQGNHVVWVCKWLQGLVTVSEGLPSTDDQADISWSGVVALAHSSVADYIVSDEFRKKHQHDLGAGSSHTFLAQTCVGYLLHFTDHPLDKEMV